MMDSDVKRYIQQEIKKQLNIILNAETGPTTESTETINSLFPGMDGILARPVVHPFGLASRAPQGTISVTARVGDHFANRMTIGHRDKGRPTDLEEGEAVIYNEQGQRIYLRNGEIQIGSKAASEPFVLGNILKTMLSTLLQTLSQHTHTSGPPGVLTSVPTQAATFTQLKASPVDDKMILSDEIFGEKSNGS